MLFNVLINIDEIPELYLFVNASVRESAITSHGVKYIPL